MHWLFRVYIGIAIMAVGCVLMATGVFERGAAWVAFAGVVWAGIAYLMRPLFAPGSGDPDE